MPGLELYQLGDLASWEAVARWLAIMHTRLATWTEPVVQRARLLRYDARFYQQWPRRALAFARRADPGVARRVEWLVGRYDQVVERLVALPLTVIHGELYASNVLVQETAEGPRVCPVDWEMAAVGPGLIDLAALTAGNWTDQDRTSLALAYHAALDLAGDRAPRPADFLTALDHCRLHLAVQWLGWSPDWSPPPEHAHDWLAEALRLAERLAL